MPAANPLTEEPKAVSVIDDDKQLQLFENQVWFDGVQRSAGVMVPKGDYVLEAEDDDYFYFKAPTQIEFRIFTDGGYD